MKDKHHAASTRLPLDHITSKLIWSYLTSYGLNFWFDDQPFKSVRCLSLAIVWIMCWCEILSGLYPLSTVVRFFLIKFPMVIMGGWSKRQANISFNSRTCSCEGQNHWWPPTFYKYYQYNPTQCKGEANLKFDYTIRCFST